MEGCDIDAMSETSRKVGDGEPWTPEISVKGGSRGFYSVGVGK